MKQNLLIIPLLFLSSLTTVSFAQTQHLSQNPNIQTQQPAWLFPIWFKNGYGVRDTIYIGHDGQATSNIDVLFGEMYVPKDTNNFQANVGYSFNSDSVLRKNFKDITTDNFFSIGYSKGYTPLTVYWDKTLFYSNNLPFPNLFPKPNGRGDFWDGYLTYPIFMTDYVNNTPPPYIDQSNSATDSIVINGQFFHQLATNSLLYIYPYDNNWMGINSISPIENDFIFYPNPVKNEMTVTNLGSFYFSYSVLDVLGNKVIFSDEKNGRSAHVNFEELSPGLYFIWIKTPQATFAKKIIKIP